MGKTSEKRGKRGMENQRIGRKTEMKDSGRERKRNGKGEAERYTETTERGDNVRENEID